ncbi:phosphopantetheine-binding protein [Paenibacillus sp. WQ 127069]|uniref:Phosphopantetheine-binding protein n=1 Tax=Paenibacillus baimaensis TaxID=2982185 RepID=A0ABT2UVV9_9BACL|nr:phosphopantetheine-binding protein [Paenibacillus sp. WQ 127069]MCU6797814.1 phosphopantetheine-binding protein [Paenibacillus sp. WQ 127069]
MLTIIIPRTTHDTELLDILERVLKQEREVLESIEPDDDLIEYNLNSILVVELVVELEIVYGIEIDDDDLLTENVSTLRRIQELVGKYQQIK